MDASEDTSRERWGRKKRLTNKLLQKTMWSTANTLSTWSVQLELGIRNTNVVPLPLLSR